MILLKALAFKDILSLYGSSRLCVIIFAYVRLNAYWARLLGLF
ncbi:hypothetical protein VL20_3889 [Microcystis panniformis FACHB-1757]|uniref:Uncharacterized protein n=1 Tax=Microcystis panniformis FACHB-1757 TaxID=1638788 RepID=A0A0K1S4D7_9CHRO|nr:hypothetical protein VL20_3889 [Microcystis panniformis FACHB-1757]